MVHAVKISIGHFVNNAGLPVAAGGILHEREVDARISCSGNLTGG
jgi:hypothetical protein